MTTDISAVVRDCTAASDEARMTFPQVVGRLMQAGVERYHADLRRAEKTYYRLDGWSEIVHAAPVAGEPAQTFSAEGVSAAIRASQAQAIDYKTFCERVIAAGCVGYIVSLTGRRAVYYGRSGETFVEPFPSAV